MAVSAVAIVSAQSKRDIEESTPDSTPESTPQPTEDVPRERPVRDFMERYLGPPQPFGVLVSGGTSADFWRVVFAEDGPDADETVESVSRDPFLLVVGGIDLYNVLGYIDWNLTYRTDNAEGALDLYDAETDTGAGRGNVDLESTLQIPFGYLGAAFGALGAPEESVSWLNYLRFQWVPIERYFRWEFDLNDSIGTYVDENGDPQDAEGPILFPARYRERRYSLLIGGWPLEEKIGSNATFDEETIFAASTLELGFMSMRFISPMQFAVSEYDPLTGYDGAPIATRQFITTNEARGFYTRLTIGDPDILLAMVPDTLGIEVWAEWFRGRSTLTTGVFEVSDDTADPTAAATEDKLVANRYGFGGSVYRQYVFGKNDRGRFRWSLGAFWQRYAYGPPSFGQISSAFNEWQTVLTNDFLGYRAGDDVVVDFFREETFWGLKFEASIGF